MEEKVMVQLVTESEDLCYEGISLYTALQEMWYDTCGTDEYEGCKFSVRGTEKEYKYVGSLLRYCFDKGRISEEDMLEECKVA